MWQSAKTAVPALFRRRRSWRRDLLKGALPRGLVGPPPQKSGAMAEPAATDMIIAHLGNQFQPQRLPLGGALGVPPAGTSRRIAGEAGRLDQRFEPCGQRPAVEIVQCRGKPDMIELAFLVVE